MTDTELLPRSSSSADYMPLPDTASSYTAPSVASDFASLSAPAFVPGYSDISQLSGLSNMVSTTEWGRSFSAAAPDYSSLPAASYVPFSFSPAPTTNNIPFPFTSQGRTTSNLLAQIHPEFFYDIYTRNLFQNASTNLQMSDDYYEGLGVSDTVDSFVRNIDGVVNFLSPETGTKNGLFYGNLPGEGGPTGRPVETLTADDAVSPAPIFSTSRVVEEEAPKLEEAISAGTTAGIVEETLADTYNLARIILRSRYQEHQQLELQTKDSLTALKKASGDPNQKFVVPTLSHSFLENQRELARAQKDLDSANLFLEAANVTPTDTPQEAASKLFDTVYSKSGVMFDAETVAEIKERVVNQVIIPQLQTEPAAAEFGNLVRVYPGDTTRGGIIQSAVASEHAVRVNKVIEPYRNVVTESVIDSLPRGINPNNTESVAGLLKDYKEVDTKLSPLLPVDDLRRVNLRDSIDYLTELADGAPARAEALRFIRNPVGVLANQDPESVINGYSADGRRALRAAIITDPLIADSMETIKDAIDQNKKGYLNNQQLSDLVDAEKVKIKTFVETLNPIVSSHWWGDKRLQGRDYSFEKLAAASSLVLGLYAATIGKRKDREDELEMMKDLESFRTDEALRLYGGRLAISQQNRGGGGGGGGGGRATPAGSSVLSNIAQSGFGVT